MAFFLSFQGKTYPEEMEGGYLWCSKEDKNGNPKIGASIMSQIKQGDFIVHCEKGYIKAISYAKTDCKSAACPRVRYLPTPGRIGYIVYTEYHKLDTQICYSSEEIRYWLANHHIVESAFTVAGKGRQQYMCELAEEHAFFLLNKALNNAQSGTTINVLREALSELTGKEEEYNSQLLSEIEGYDFSTEIPEWEGQPKDIETTTSSATGRIIAKRDPKVAVKALHHAKNMCELDSSHITFCRKGNPKSQYMESHHLIPISKFRDFNSSLDIMENVVCLCPTCHRKLHHGDFIDKEESLKRLYNARFKALINCGIKISFEQLLSYYK